MWNGPIECRLFRFDMVKGSARGKPEKGGQIPIQDGGLSGA
jgi:putative N6-adenine-specific DNA methylase